MNEEEIDWKKAAMTAGYNEAKAREAESAANLRTLAIFALFVIYLIVSEWQ